MSTTEVLRTQLDNVRRELHKLQVENQKLRTQCSEEAREEPRGEVLRILKKYCKSFKSTVLYFRVHGSLEADISQKIPFET